MIKGDLDFVVLKLWIYKQRLEGPKDFIAKYFVEI